jgi:ADP-heptose:LPS heptosyltransferase
MRIIASNPDTIGDVLLRQPLYQALQNAGHELTLIVRPLLAPVMQSIAPGVARGDVRSQPVRPQADGREPGV